MHSMPRRTIRELQAQAALRARQTPPGRLVLGPPRELPAIRLQVAPRLAAVRRGSVACKGRQPLASAGKQRQPAGRRRLVRLTEEAPRSWVPAARAAL